ncbi:hypothetical protein [Halalkalibacter krulwichiae]|uniref:Uncharacterized protein n=1 Tax=Halalkalibacter krulwichiae TaxID=199441 RepID=A0A1X9MII8_9BACI|nr:hypothetical protein [Halalkalibacter krulwichiae]ARK31481.1 hypothetical protein BkAM31D_17460 [Halalkalibacter krulwichiae]
MDGDFSQKILLVVTVFLVISFITTRYEDVESDAPQSPLLLF